MIKKIGVLTSGGDSPGMNAAIRSVVRSGIYSGLQVYGIYDGYQGLTQNKNEKLDRYSVSDIINRGGTLLGSSRFPEFKNNNIRQVAINNMKNKGIDALIVIGGNGSYIGAKKLTNMGLPCICLPGTIDNDINGTDYTIGFYTALETIIEAIDRIRDTSSSHQRISIVEVMGKHCGNLTLAAAIAGGCEFIITPENPFKSQDLIYEIKAGISKGKKHAIIAITEHICNVTQLAAVIEKKTGRETRATVLGHIQRGGKPVAYDRILASRMGALSVKLLLEGQNDGKCIGMKNGQLIFYKLPNNNIIDNNKNIFQSDLFKIAKQLC